MRITNNSLNVGWLKEGSSGICLSQLFARGVDRKSDSLPLQRRDRVYQRSDLTLSKGKQRQRENDLTLSGSVTASTTEDTPDRHKELPRLLENLHHPIPKRGRVCQRSDLTDPEVWPRQPEK